MSLYKISVVFSYFDSIHFDFDKEGTRDNIYKQMIKVHKKHGCFFWEGVHIDLNRANYIRKLNDKANN